MGIEDRIKERIDKYQLRQVNSSHNSRKSLEIIWAYPNYMDNLKLPFQGFKLHVSATILNSHQIFDITISYLLENFLAFKVIGNNSLLGKLNDNYFGYSQVGKFITIYPLNDDSL